MPSPIAYSLPVSQDIIPLPSSSLGEHLLTNNHTFQRTKRKGDIHRKQKPNTKAPASGNHTGHHLLSSSANHAGGKVPISSHQDGEKLANVYLAGT